MLSFAEEIVLLALGDSGTFKKVREDTLAHAIGGAVLVDLALLNRIDTDLKNLMLVSLEPTGNSILDDALKMIGKNRGNRTARYWLKAFAARAKEIKEQVLARLVEKRILRCDEKKILQVFGVRKYTTVDHVEREEIRTRLRRLIFSDDIPDPRDVVLLSLIEACHLFSEILSPQEHARVRPRIRLIGKLDLIGQEVNRMIQEIEREIALALRSAG